MVEEIKNIEKVEKFYLKDGNDNPTIGLKDYQAMKESTPFLLPLIVAKVTIENGETTVTNHDDSVMNKDQANSARKHFNSLLQDEYKKNRDDEFILETIEKTDQLIDLIKENSEMVALIEDIFSASGNNDQNIHTIKIMGAVHDTSKSFKIANNNLDDEWKHKNNESFPIGKIFATKKKSGKAYNPYAPAQTVLEKMFPELFVKATKKN